MIYQLKRHIVIFPNNTVSRMASKKSYRLREATISDAASVLEIYRPFVTHSVTSLEYEVPTVEEMQRRIQTTLPNFPWIICEAEDGSIAGYAYGSKHQVREGYQWIVETGIYAASNCRGHGVGSLLYKKLCEILKAQGYIHALAKISGDNAGSIEFHKKLGFIFASVWKNCGNKFGKWVDVTWCVKELNELVDNPAKPLPYSEIAEQIRLN